MLLIIAKSLLNHKFDLKLTNHPVFWAIVFYLGWLLITSFASEMPLVSFKYTLVRVWFIAVFFFIAYLFFQRNSRYFLLYTGGYLGGLLIVILISLNTQFERGLFSKFSAHGACNPYFTDHTSYGAAIALVIPIVASFIFAAKSKRMKWFLSAFAFFLTSALVLSYSRAAWLSLIFGIGIWFVWWLKIKIRTILLITLTIVALAFIFQNRISWWLNSYETASSGNLQEHLHSVVNVKTDDSNVERLNRWVAAIRMAEEKPTFGWGPGTYMFQYAPYQASYLRTLESSNLGQKGNAHSEYLGLMAEAGWPGVLGYISILLLVFYRGFKLLKLHSSINERFLVLGALIGL
ncbi:MAG TPA: O-antigen ligase family protein, partial [Tenuifilaceae bacterium]|nr:O-antigen ligase family protein [Tenuifilaceae bacterium]